MGEWHKVEQVKDDRYPCRGCEAGSASYSCYEDPVTKEIWVKTDSCQETCQRYKDWVKGRFTLEK